MNLITSNSCIIFGCVDRRQSYKFLGKLMVLTQVTM
jgi:hypothetical protein